MSQKPENQFISGVHKYIPDVYKEKMYNPYRSGTADVWYSGKDGDLWIEYKYIPKIPKKIEIIPALTDRQVKWLNDRYAETRNIAVVLGCPDGGVIYTHRSWTIPMQPSEWIDCIVSRKELAEWIRSKTGTSPCLTSYLEPPKPVKTFTK